MDNAKGQNNGSPINRSGEIFSGDSSPYEKARSSSGEEIKEELNPREVYSPNTTAEPIYQTEAQDAGIQAESPAGYNDSQSPSFISGSGGSKKILILLFFAIALVLAGFLVIRFFFQRNGVNQTEKDQVSIVYWGLWDDEAIMEPIISEFTRSNPNITVKYEKQSQKLYRERLQAALERGEGPDIFKLHNTWLPMFYPHLDAVPDSVYTQEEYSQVFYPVIKDDFSLEGKTYAVSLSIDGLVMLYNDDILRSANVSVPKTWDELADASGKVTVKKGKEIVTAGVALGKAKNIPHFSDILTLMFIQNGTILNQGLLSCIDETKDTCAVEALAFYSQFAEEPNNVWSEGMDDAIMAFGQGKLAFLFVPSWQILNIKAAFPDINLMVAEVPQLPCLADPCEKIYWASYWAEGVSAKSKVKSSAWEFIKFLSSSGSMQKRYELQLKTRNLFGEVYSRQDISQALLENPYLAPVVRQAGSMRSFWTASSTGDGETGLNSALNTYLENAVNSLSEGASPDSAIRTANNGFLEVYQRFGISSN